MRQQHFWECNAWFLYYEYLCFARTVAVVFNERVQQSKNYIMKTKSQIVRVGGSDSTYTTVAKRASFCMESDFSNSSRSICGPSSGVSVFYRSSSLRASLVMQVARARRFFFNNSSSSGRRRFISLRFQLFHKLLLGVFRRVVLRGRHDVSRLAVRRGHGARGDQVARDFRESNFGMKEASSSSITTSSLRPREAQLSLHDDDEDDDDDCCSCCRWCCSSRP